MGTVWHPGRMATSPAVHLDINCDPCLFNPGTAGSATIQQMEDVQATQVDLNQNLRKCLMCVSSSVEELLYGYTKKREKMYKCIPYLEE